MRDLSGYMFAGVGKDDSPSGLSATGNVMRDEATERALQSWLESVGLHFDPFRVLDAGADPWLPAYLVGHELFEEIWGDWPSFVFASAGGGKSAFRVRLARACRVGQDGRRVFPIVYKVPSPAVLGGLSPSLDAHLHALSQAAASELLLQLAYRPTRFLDLDQEAQRSVRRVLDWNLPGSLEYFIEQLEMAGNLTPLVEAFDPTAKGLLNPPDPSSIRELCAMLADLPAASFERPAPQIRFENLIGLVLDPLHFEAVYLLVDGVDAHIEAISEPQMALALIQPLLHRTRDWAESRIFAKYFLPEELQQPVEALLTSLTQEIKSIRIKWTHDALVEVLRERLRIASEGMFNSLDAISSPGLRNAEAELVRIAEPRPREVLVLSEQLLIEHARRPDANLKLEPEDLDAACRWYTEDRQLSSAS